MLHSILVNYRYEAEAWKTKTTNGCLINHSDGLLWLAVSSGCAQLRFISPRKCFVSFCRWLEKRRLPSGAKHGSYRLAVRRRQRWTGSSALQISSATLQWVSESHRQWGELCFKCTTKTNLNNYKVPLWKIKCVNVLKIYCRYRKLIVSMSLVHFQCTKNKFNITTGGTLVCCVVSVL